MHEDVKKHLELVQGVINRMANNTFVLKGWTVTLTAALMALAAKDSNRLYSIVALLPALSFWGLDAYYLRQERLFRKLYDDLRLSSPDTVSKWEPYSMSTKKYTTKVDGWLKTLVTPTILLLHGAVVIAVLILVCSLRKIF